ncbi:hypothetical protein CTM97_04310 [Photobacterium phosphoreum]|uniref:Type I restriction modification DNA specificity domain-containing protein n=1 Tax=Photobacterium phosphoreum TaxID=659 RepID=A0A2T3JWL2_PHOPO|nr:restriction endonuclease subunit S [Photobacterium phosphoreum]PSU25770.1 hypothetical protein CTM96_08660 [Photobacterium phosphoreum]PSU43586.1 hypothetical protein CTM97_04310 [Photobacterium phosphoreum]PSU53681.1 hypothetical protein C9J18_04565 [Photobacterium phosphoreum]
MNNQLPDEWSSSIFANLFDIAIGGTPSRNEPLYWDASRTSGNNWVSIKDLKGKTILDTAEQITDLGIKKSNVKLVPKGTIMMSFKLSVGRVAFAGKNLYTNEAIAAFIPKDKMSIDLRYFYQGLQFWDLLGDIDQAVKGVTLNKEKIRNIEAILPPFPEQQKIAAILTSVDDVIEKTQAQINKLKDLKTGMMQELLTCGVGVDGKPHTEFKDSPVGRIPKGWDCVELDTLKHPSKYSCVGGPFGSDLTAKHYIDTAGVPVIRGTNIPLNFERFKEDNFVYVTEEKADLLVKNMAYQGDLVFTQRGTMGQVGLIPLDSKFKRYVVSQSQMKLTVNETIVSSEFLYQFFLSNNFMKQLELETIATGLPHINLGILKAFKVPIPSLSEQNEIVDILTSIDKRCLFFISKLNKLKDLKKALMQDLLTGKVRVNVD